ncbi:extensin [Streptomyces massasporeus]|uniref:extensin n=1 Tax=Streptomyces massasporeus TaxID=67324 RepID=UPI003710FB35
MQRTPVPHPPSTPLPVVQTLFRKKPKPAPEATPPSTTGALAAAAAATIATTLTNRTAPQPTTHSGHFGHSDAPPPYTPHADPPPTPPPPPPPAYTEVPTGSFDPRELTDFQLDELVHRIIGRITRLIRTELRLDRERIGRLRDPRH